MDMWVVSTFWLLWMMQLWMCVCAQVLSHVWLFASPWTVAHQAPLSMGFSRQKYWSGLPLPTPGIFPHLWTLVYKYLFEYLLSNFLVICTEEGFSSDSPIKNPPSVQETWIWALSQQDPLQEGMATHSSILAWTIPWKEEPGRLQSRGSQRVRHNWSGLAHTHRSRIAESYSNLMFNFVRNYHIASKVWNLTLNTRRFILWKNFFTVWISSVLPLEAILAWRVCHSGWLKHIKKICQLLTHSEKQNKATSGMSPSICSYHCSLIYHDTDYYFNLIICVLYCFAVFRLLPTLTT